MIGIISYLPDSEIKEKRLRAVKSQLNWIFELFVYFHEKFINKKYIINNYDNAKKNFQKNF